MLTLMRGACGITGVLLLTTLAGAAGRTAPTPAGPLHVEPATLELTHSRRPHSLLVTGVSANGLALDLTAQATYRSSNPAVATVDALGWVQPVSTGSTEVTVQATGKSAVVKVNVKLPAKAPQPSFVHEIMPVLSKGGCNQGACHGYSLGKNGFKLSLRGSDPGDDYTSLTDEFFERRINRHNPEASLLLAKPLGDVPHQGGVRFRHGSLLHHYLLDWIRADAPSDLADPVKLKSVEIYPRKVVLKPGMQHGLQLLAHYSDGSVRDVTRLGIFTVNTERVASVSEDGLVSARELGETAVSGRFERIFATANFIVLEPNASFKATPVPEDNLIDKFVIRKLNDLNIHPSELADDATFLRRVHIDLIGVQPSADEVLVFLKDTAPDKRTRVIDALFRRPEFVDRWSLKWGDLLQNSRKHLSEPAVYAQREWLRGAIASNMPLDEFARRLLTARGGFADDPASGFLAVSKDADDSLQRVTQVFCGVRMLCARCHAHPFESWTQADYYGLHSFFNQVGTKVDPHLANIPRARTLIVNKAAGYSINTRSRKLQRPRFLGGVEPELPANVDRRVAYAKWLTAPENPFFARSLTNRIWSYFYHRGIIEPVDDVRTTNPPINPELLDALTKDFVAHKFDVRHLMRTIVTSRTYQRSSIANETNIHDDMNFSRAIPRRLPAESLLDSLVQATGVPEGFGGAPAGFTAQQLPDAEVQSEFLSLFGKPGRVEACECERDDGSNLLQALHMVNGSTIQRRVAGNGRLPGLLRQKLDDRQLIEQLYLWSVCRKPDDHELAVSLSFFLKYGAKKRTEAAQDLMWALLNSKDFLLLH